MTPTKQTQRVRVQFIEVFVGKEINVFRNAGIVKQTLPFLCTQGRVKVLPMFKFLKINCTCKCMSVSV